MKVSRFELILMFLVLCISGNPLFIYTESNLLYVVSVVIMFVLSFVKRKALCNRKLFFWLTCTFFLFFFQNSYLELTSIKADANFIARLYIAFLAASFFGYRFRDVYFKVMVVLCAISIPCYLLQLSGVCFGYEVNRYKCILVYSFIMESERNMGMFWEPGAFQGFIMLVPLLYSDNLKKLWNNNKKECVILILALLTTKSTTGFLAFAAFIFLNILLEGKINVFLKTILIMLAIVGFSLVWAQDFMGEKLMNEYEELQTMQNGQVSWNRMAVMIIDFQNIMRHPIIGNGFMDNSRYGILGELMRGAGNGFTGTINMLGIPFMLLFFIGVFKNLVHMSKVKRYVFIFIFILLLNGEYFLNYPLFWSLLFIKFPQHERTIGTINRT